VLLAGSIAWVQALLTARMTYANAMALTATIVFTAASIVISLGRERRGVTFGKGASEPQGFEVVMPRPPERELESDPM
jgi:hypothetical protein